jgi:hypothetical protein
MRGTYKKSSCIDPASRQKWQEEKLVSKFDEKTFEDSSSFLQNQN